MSVIVFMDGVLRNQLNKQPILEGVVLYKSIKEKNSIVVVGPDQRDKTEHWLRSHKIDFDDILENSSITHGKDEFAQCQSLRSKGKIEFVVTSNMELAKQLLEAGYNTLLFLHPLYLRPEFRPDAPEGVKPWSEIEKEYDRQLGLFIEDSRV
jgi:hypothetical protein